MIRYILARHLCSHLPPILANRVLPLLYSREHAEAAPVSFVTRARTGSLYSGSTGDVHMYQLGTCGYFNWRTWAIALAICKKGDSIIEIGANVGTETVGFADIVTELGKVYAFET